MSSYPISRKSAQGIPNRRSVFSSPDTASNKPRSPLQTLLSNENMVPTKKQKLSSKRLKPKRLIVESEEDSSDSGIFSLREDPVVVPVVYAAASPDDSFAFLDDLEPSQNDAGGFGVASASTRVARARGSLSSASSSESASSCAFLTNKEMADKIYEKEDLLLKDVPACQMQTINNLTHLSKD
jgi:hypothetical protein